LILRRSLSPIQITLKTTSAQSPSVVPPSDGLSSFPIPSAEIASESSALGGPPAESKNSTRKESMKRRRNELRQEYDLAKLKGGVRGKYYKRAQAGTNLVLLAPDVARVFKDSNSVNRALRRLLPGKASKADGPRGKTGNGRRRAAS
jgi:hypothetical protein